jgi:hypothetical protein
MMRISFVSILTTIIYVVKTHKYYIEKKIDDFGIFFTSRSYTRDWTSVCYAGRAFCSEIVQAFLSLIYHGTILQLNDSRTEYIHLL